MVVFVSVCYVVHVDLLCLFEYVGLLCMYLYICIVWCVVIESIIVLIECT